MLIDWFTVGAQAVNFLILVWLMKRFLYEPVLAAIDARESKIAGELQQAADAKAQAQKERDELRVQTEALQGQRAELLRADAAEAAARRQHLIEDARNESQRLRSDSMTALTAEQTALKTELVKRTRQEVFALARKTLTDLADTTLEGQILEVFLKRVAEMTDAQKSDLVPPPARANTTAIVFRSAFELTPAQRVNTAAALSQWPCKGTPLQFETSPDLISGLELNVDGHKLAWNISAYLTTVEEAVEALLITAGSASNREPDVQHAA